MPVSSFTPPSVDADRERDDRAEHPSWAHWNGQLKHRYTLGVEDELMLLDPASWSLAQSSDRVLAGLSDELSTRTSPETHAAVIELRSSVHTDVDGIAAALASLRSRLGNELDAIGLAAAAAGTHPLTLWHETVVSAAARYRRLDDSMRVLAWREPTLALPVHVGIPVPEDATRVLNGLRRNAPVLLALAANSPFWQGRDTGFASARTGLAENRFLAARDGMDARLIDPTARRLIPVRDAGHPGGRMPSSCPRPRVCRCPRSCGAARGRQRGRPSTRVRSRHRPGSTWSQASPTGSSRRRGTARRQAEPVN